MSKKMQRNFSQHMMEDCTYHNEKECMILDFPQGKFHWQISLLSIVTFLCTTIVVFLCSTI